MKRALIALGCLVVVLVAGALIAPSFIDWNKYKEPIQAEAERLTGRDVSVGGHLSFSILPAPALSADDVRIANIPGAAADDFAQVKSLRVKVAFFPLLSGHVRVRQVTLVEPKISLEVTADGTRNWVFTNSGKTPGASADQTSGSTGLLQAVRLDNFVIENGDITFRDERKTATVGAPVEQQIKGLNAVIQAQTLQGPVKASGDGVYRTVPISFTLDAGQYAKGRAMPVSIQLKARNEPVQASFNGVVTDAPPHASVNGKLTVGGDDLAGLLRIFRAEAGVTEGSPPNFTSHKPFSLDAKVTGSVAEAKLDDIDLGIGDAHGSGAATVSLDQGPKFDVALQMNSIDLDKLLKAGAAPQRSTPGPTVVDIAPKDGATFDLPTKANGSLDLGVAAIAYHGGTVRQFRFTADLKNGQVSINRASALLPGGSDVSATGTLTAANGKPQFTGKVKGTSSNVRAILDWFNANPTEIPADRLTKLVLTSGVTLDGGDAQFSDLDVALDTSRITGSGSLTLGARPTIGLDVDVDRFNLDAYLGHEPEAPVDDGDKAAPPPPKPAPPAHPLAFLTDFDGTLKARVAHLTWLGVSADSVTLDSSLKDGVATLASFAAGDVSGAKVAATGSAQGFANQLAYKADVDLDTKDLADFLRSVDVTVPFARDTLGNAKLKLGVDVAGEKHTVSVSGTVGKTTVMATRDDTGPAKGRQFNVRFDMKDPSLADLSRQFEIGFSPIDSSSDTPVSLSGEASGTDMKASVKLHGTVKGGSIDAAGDLASLDTKPTYNLDVSLHHGEFADLARLLGFDYDRAAGTVGSVTAKARVAGDATHADLSSIQANLGETTATGSASIDVSGQIPRISAKLVAGVISADQFLAKSNTGVKQAIEAGRIDPGMRRWSRKRLDLDWLTAYDGDVELRADHLAVGDYDFAGPDIKLLLNNGTLTVRQFTGQLFGGNLDLRAVLRGQGTPDLSLTFSLSNGSVEQALSTLAGLKTAAGTFSANGSIAANGSNQFEMISDMTGSATVKARNGVLRGIDLKRIATGAGNVATMDDISKLLSQATTQGTTPYKSIQATLRLDNGMITAQNISADIDSSTGAIDASVDLPHWTASVDSRFRLKDLAGSPPIGIVLTGALNAPRRDVRTANMEQFLAKNVDETMLKGVIEQDNKGLNELLGSGKSPAPETQAPVPNQPAQPQPETPQQ